MNLAEQLRARAIIAKANRDRICSDKIIEVVKLKADIAAEKGEFSFLFYLDSNHWEVEHARLAASALKRDYGFLATVIMKYGADNGDDPAIGRYVLEICW